MREFKDVLAEVNKRYHSMYFSGVAVAGETDSVWIFQTSMPEGEEYLEPNPIIVDKRTGKMRWGFPFVPRDREVIYSAKQIDLKSYKDKK